MATKVASMKDSLSDKMRACSLISGDTYAPFEELRPSMIMFVVAYTGVFDLKTLYNNINIKPEYNGVYRDMPVGPDGTFVAKGMGDERVGAIRTFRSKSCFRNIVSVDMSILGDNINLKISNTCHIQGAGGRSLPQIEYASEMLIYQLNQLPCLINNPLRLQKVRVGRINYNFQLNFQLNLAAVARELQGYNSLAVVYDNTINQPLRAGRIASNSQQILEEMSKRSKRSKEPSHLFIMRISGRIMLGGPDVYELKELYESFIVWVRLNRDLIRQK